MFLLSQVLLADSAEGAIAPQMDAPALNMTMPFTTLDEVWEELNSLVG